MPSAFSASEIELDALVALDRYPIHDLTSSVRDALVADARDQMAAYGCCRMSNFVRPDAVERMQVEATSLHHRVFWSSQDHTPYFSPSDHSFPPGHPRRTLQHRETGFINSDVLVAD